MDSVKKRLFLGYQLPLSPVEAADDAVPHQKKPDDDPKKMPFYLWEILAQTGSDSPFCLKELNLCFPLLTCYLPAFGKKKQSQQKKNSDSDQPRLK